MLPGYNSSSVSEGLGPNSLEGKGIFQLGGDYPGLLTKNSVGE
jgi:hypothetical protein